MSELFDPGYRTWRDLAHAIDFAIACAGEALICACHREPSPTAKEAIEYLLDCARRRVDTDRSLKSMEELADRQQRAGHISMAYAIDSAIHAFRASQHNIPSHVHGLANDAAQTALNADSTAVVEGAPEPRCRITRIYADHLARDLELDANVVVAALAANIEPEVL
jgi:hypothetical protein